MWNKNCKLKAFCTLKSDPIVSIFGVLIYIMEGNVIYDYISWKLVGAFFFSFFFFIIGFFGCLSFDKNDLQRRWIHIRKCRCWLVLFSCLVSGYGSCTYPSSARYVTRLPFKSEATQLFLQRMKILFICIIPRYGG